MTTPSTIGVGVLGLGFMGRNHIRAYRAAADAGYACQLVAVADGDPARRTGQASAAGNLGPASDEPLFDPSIVKACADPDEVLRDPRVHLVSICTYSDTHVDLALRALAAGKHVLVEKPVAVRSDQVRRLADAARHARTLCMPAMCMRFWPGWDWLRDRVRDGSLGMVRSATFQRIGAGPSWAPEFYRDPNRSGGALVDLHIHDADFIYWCFGKPQAVSSAGTDQHLTTLYHFDHGPRHIAAEGAWDLTPTAGFRMKFLVNFEHATAEFDIGHATPLRLHRPAGTEPVQLDPLSGYDGEVRHLLAAIASGRRDLTATLDEAVAVAELLEAERKSFETATPVRLA